MYVTTKRAVCPPPILFFYYLKRYPTTPLLFLKGEGEGRRRTGGEGQKCGEGGKYSHIGGKGGPGQSPAPGPGISQYGPGRQGCQLLTPGPPFPLSPLPPSPLPFPQPSPLCLHTPLIHSSAPSPLQPERVC